MFTAAPILSHSDLTSDFEVFTSSTSRRISGLTISNAFTFSGLPVEIRDDDNNLLAIIVCPASGTFEWSVEWVAENGLSIEAVALGANLTATVVHSQAGA
jgi:hypothetical protein